MLRIVTDGAADLPDGWEGEYDIQIVPINIHFGEATYLQYVDMDLNQFYDKVASSSASLEINLGPGTAGLVLYPAE